MIPGLGGAPAVGGGAKVSSSATATGRQSTGGQTIGGLNFGNSGSGIDTKTILIGVGTLLGYAFLKKQKIL